FLPRRFPPATPALSSSTINLLSATPRFAPGFFANAFLLDAITARFVCATTTASGESFAAKWFAPSPATPSAGARVHAGRRCFSTAPWPDAVAFAGQTRSKVRRQSDRFWRAGPARARSGAPAPDRPPPRRSAPPARRQQHFAHNRRWLHRRRATVLKLFSDARPDDDGRRDYWAERSFVFEDLP